MDGNCVIWRSLDWDVPGPGPAGSMGSWARFGAVVAQTGRYGMRLK